MEMQKLSTKPLKGFRDFPPEEWAIQQYIFSIWKKVCESYGYKEYNGPVLESADIYNKSGDDVGTSGKELYTFTDRGERNLAIRPEMTPSVGRMIAEYGKRYSKPIRWYSIAQFFRAENPQRGRGREFYQLNFDTFGNKSIYSDAEILQMAIDIMLAYGADEKMFVLYLNNRKLMNSALMSILGDETLVVPVIRLIDKRGKITDDAIRVSLKEMGLDTDQIDKLYEFLKMDTEKLLQYRELDGAEELIEVIKLLKDTKYYKYIEFNPALARGFDYYTGMVFEVFDKNPQNNRSMFGGGRYDNLVDMFSNESISAVGCAPGDVTARIFLESWGLLPQLSITRSDRYYLPLLVSDAYASVIEIAERLRKDGNCVIIGTEVESITKALSTANKNGYNFVVFIAEEELRNKEYKVKNLLTGEQNSFKLN